METSGQKKSCTDVTWRWLMSNKKILAIGLAVGFVIGVGITLIIYRLATRSNSTPSKGQLQYGVQEAPSDPEVVKYAPVVDRIVSHLTNGPGKGQTWKRLAEFTDTFGHRMTGSESLEKSIDYLEEKFRKEFERVYTEEFSVKRWERGNDSATLLEPFHYGLNILALGGTGPTPNGGVTAEVLVVDDVKDLAHLDATGKIVVCNVVWKGSYRATVSVRFDCAPAAEKAGAIAALIRSVAPFSVDTPHTGMSSENTIPHAAITIEDSAMMKRMQDRNQTVKMHLKIDSGPAGTGITRNLIAEMRGSEKPDEIVLFGGHIDSWDVGTGAMDNGGGAFISWQAMTVMKDLGLKPRRTTRLVMWSAEEQGGYDGGKQYFDNHKDEVANMSLVMESDCGTFAPTSVHLVAGESARGKIREIAKFFSRFNASMVGENGYEADIRSWIDAGVPGLNLQARGPEDLYYFWFHHAKSDTMEVEDPNNLDVGASIWTIMAYIVADLDEMIPRS